MQYPTLPNIPDTVFPLIIALGAIIKDIKILIYIFKSTNLNVHFGGKLGKY